MMTKISKSFNNQFFLKQFVVDLLAVVLSQQGQNTNSNTNKNTNRDTNVNTDTNTNTKIQIRIRSPLTQNYLRVKNCPLPENACVPSQFLPNCASSPDGGPQIISFNRTAAKHRPRGGFINSPNLTTSSPVFGSHMVHCSLQMSPHGICAQKIRKIVFPKF